MYEMYRVTTHFGLNVGDVEIVLQNVKNLQQLYNTKTLHLQY